MVTQRGAEGGRGSCGEGDTESLESALAPWRGRGKAVR
jgi:hypothetical protein